jgi:hypothetical protein
MRLLLRSLGPGVITGAADDDPSGIATYSVAGAQLGTKLLWTARIIKGRPFEVGFERDPKLYREEHPQ